VLYCREERFLSVEIIRKRSRLLEFFPGLELKQLFAGLKHLQRGIEKLSVKYAEETLFPLPESLREITLSLLPEDDTALVFTPLQSGIDVSAAAAFDDLKESLLYKYMPESREGSLTDKEVWEKVYKKHFQEQRILEKLREHTIVTRHDHIPFDFAWKNGQWHCYAPVSFDLHKSDSVKNKVYRWRGKLAELSTSQEEVAVHLLTSMPADRGLRDFIMEILQGQKEGNARFYIVTPEAAPAFSQQLLLEMKEHE
jgi:hypothetical protein